MSDSDLPQRLQKVLAQRGAGSRRAIEELIIAGKVKVNGQLAKLGDKVLPDAQITIDGREIAVAGQVHRIILYNKPEGQICTRSDPEGRPTVFDALPALKNQRWVAVGRLDINSSGLILFTTDGELANRLMHPSKQIEREYAVRILGELTPRKLKNITTGVFLPDGVEAKFKRVKFAGGQGANSWYHVVLTQGRYREVRQIFQTQELQVSRLIRIRYGDVHLPKDLPEGEYIELPYNYR